MMLTCYVVNVCGHVENNVPLSLVQRYDFSFGRARYNERKFALFGEKGVFFFARGLIGFVASLRLVTGGERKPAFVACGLCLVGPSHGVWHFVVPV